MQDKFITLTHEFIKDDRLTMQEKIVYMEIVNLSSLGMGCIALNIHFEKAFGISKKSVSNTISNLVKKGFIESEISDRNHKRILSIKNGHASIKCGESKDNNTLNKETPKILTSNVLSKLTNSLTEEHIKKFIQYRKEIKHPIKTERAILGFIKNVNEVLQKGLTIDYIFNKMMEKEWRTIELSYFSKQELSQNIQKVVGQYYEGLGKFAGYNSQGFERYE